MADDESYQGERPLLHCKEDPVLYDAGGRPLTRRIGFVTMQTTCSTRLSAGALAKERSGQSPSEGGKKA